MLIFIYINSSIYIIYLLTKIKVNNNIIMHYSYYLKIIYCTTTDMNPIS